MVKYSKTNLLLISALFLFISACKKDSITPISGVFIAGTEYDDAVLWRDTVMTKLPRTYGTSATASSVYVTATDVYVAGQDGGFPVLWKNGVEAKLAPEGGGTSSVFVSGNDVYVAGADGFNPVYWKNGTEVVLPLSEGIQSATAYSICVSGNDVYVVGDQYPARLGVATIWKNGVPTTLADYTLFSYASSVYVVGNDVYIAGSISHAPYSYGAVYWKNNVVNVLSTGSSSANSIFVDGSDVYVFGEDSYNNQYTNTYWKNGVPVRLSGGALRFSASSIYVKNGDVYMAGSTWDTDSYYSATYWKNNTAFTIGPQSENYLYLGDIGSVATSIFVR